MVIPKSTNKNAIRNVAVFWYFHNSFTLLIRFMIRTYSNIIRRNMAHFEDYNVKVFFTKKCQHQLFLTFVVNLFSKLVSIMYLIGPYITTSDIVSFRKLSFDSTFIYPSLRIESARATKWI